MDIDLEDLAAGYGHRPASQAALARAARAAESVQLGSGDVAVDAGGGRGHHTAAWVQRDAFAVVLDPGRGMIQASSRLPSVAVVCGRSQDIPLRGASVRLIYFHLSLHYGDWRVALNEAVRVLMPGGECWIWTMGETHHRSSFLAKWFPSVGDIDTIRFPEPAEVVEHLGRLTGYVETGKETETKLMPAGRWRAAVAARFVSTLQLLTHEELLSGLARFDEAYPEDGEIIEYDLTFDWIRGVL